MGTFLSKHKENKDYALMRLEIKQLRQRQFHLYNNIDCIDKDLNEAKEHIRDLIDFIKHHYHSEGSGFAGSK